MSQNKRNIRNPYPGIRSFNVEEQNLFYGRETQVNEIAEILNKTHFVAISGASGSGKSSVIKAGLIPFFKKETNNCFEYLIFRPGNSPLKNMADEFMMLLIKKGYDPKDARKNASLILRDENAIEQIVTDFIQTETLFIYIDQFEEIFRYRTNELLHNTEEKSDLFIKSIVNSTKLKNKKIFISISLRSDFLSDCTIFTGLPELINQGHYLLPNLTELQKVEAVVKPAEHAGAKISDSLIEEIKNNIKVSEISLPVLQHSLMRTWDFWLLNSPDNVPIDIEHYKSIGGIDSALSVHAETIYFSLTDTQKKLTEKIFRALIFWGNDERGTRSPQKLSTLCKIVNAKEMEVIEILNIFRAEGNSFLMPNEEVSLNSDTIIDISHESIMRVWTRLVEWVSVETQSAQIYSRLSRSAELYQIGKTGLLVNPDLQIALNWLNDDRPNQYWAMRYDPAFERVVNYVLYSKKEYDKSIVAKEEKQKRSLKRARITSIFFGVITLVSLLFLVVAMNLRFKAQQSEKEAINKQQLAIKQSFIAEERRKEAIALQLIAKQQQEIAEQNRLIAERQKQYAVAQQKEALYQKQQAVISRQEAEEARDLAIKLQKDAEKLRDLAIEQKLIIEQEKIKVEKSEAKTDTLRRLAIVQNLAIQSIKYFQDNLKSQNLTQDDIDLPYILALQAYNFNKIYNKGKIYSEVFESFMLLANKKLELEKHFSDAVRTLTISTDNFYLVAGGNEGKIVKYNLNTPENYETLNCSAYGSSGFRKVVFSPDNKLLIAGSKNGEILLWNSDAVNLKPINYNISNDIISNILFYENQKFIVSTYSGKLIFFEYNGLIIKMLTEINISKKIVEFDLNLSNTKIVIATESGEILIYNISTKEKEMEYISDAGKISTINWYSENKLLVGYSIGLVEDINITSKKIIKKWFAHNSAVSAVIYSFINDWIITAGYDGKIKIWKNKTITDEPIEIKGHTTWIYSIVLDKNEKKLISADASGKIIISEIDIEELKAEIRSKVSKNMSKENWIKFVGEGIDYSESLPEIN